MLAEGFPRVSFFQPGLLNREGRHDSRFGEELALTLGVPAIAVTAVAQAMALDAAAKTGPAVSILTNAEITQLSKLAGSAPKSVL